MSRAEIPSSFYHEMLLTLVARGVASGLDLKAARARAKEQMAGAFFPSSKAEQSSLQKDHDDERSNDWTR